jgi:Xaa-Pro aminopeptidase
MGIINANDLMPSNADGTLPYHPNSDLFYLSGIEQEESIMVLNPGAQNARDRAVLFIRRPDELLKIWEGYKLDKKDARILSGISRIYWLDEFWSVYSTLARGSKTFYLNDNEHQRADNPVETSDQRFKKEIRKRYPKRKLGRLAPLLHELRFVKKPQEIVLIQQAVQVTVSGYRRVLEVIRPGMMEYEVEAEWARTFISNRCKFAYGPIVASGRNACVLHYLQNDQPCKKGDLLLMDVGASYANYNADLTRTIPVSGKFNRRQRAVYNAVLRVLKKSIENASVGKSLKEWTREAQDLMNEELVSLKLLSLRDIKKQDPKNPACRKYFMHGLGHSLGLDVHDVSNGQSVLRENSVFTVEPGIYIPQEKIGIRLEENIVITPKGPLILTKNAPIEPDEIEAIMNSKS